MNGTQNLRNDLDEESSAMAEISPEALHSTAM